MLFHSSIRTELARSFGATLVVLFTIVVTMILIRTLGQASTGSVDPKEVLLVLGYTVLGRLPIVLTVALFMAVVSVLSRMYRDSEMVIWMCAGEGLAGLLSPILRFAWPVLTAIGVLVLVAWPWANQQAADLKDRFEQRGDLQRVAPGQFQEAATGRRVFFIDKDTANGTQGRNVFISSSDARQDTVISARSARIVKTEGQQFLLLSNGQRLDSTADLQSLKVSEFDEYSTRVSDKALTLDSEGQMKARSTLRLFGDPSPAAQGELSWRLGLVACAFNLMLLGLAVSSGNPRAGRSGNLAFSLFAFFAYYNVLNLGEHWVTHQKVPFLTFMLALHGSAFVLALIWVAKRHLNISLRCALRAWLKPAHLSAPESAA